MFATSLVLAALFTLSGSFVLVMQSGWGRQKIGLMLTKIVQESGWHATIGETSGVFPSEITFHHVLLQSPQNDFITIQTIRVEFSLIHLLKKEITFNKFYADQIEWQPANENISHPSQEAIPKEPGKSAFGLGQSPYNRRSQTDTYWINTHPFAKPAVVDSGELSLMPKNRFSRFFGYVWAGVPFIIHFSDLKLTNIRLPERQNAFDIAGQIKIGRYNRMAFAKLTAQMSGLPDNQASVVLRIHPNRQMQIKLNVKSPAINEVVPDLPIQANGNISLYAKGSLKAFYDAIFNHTPIASIKGMIHGAVQIEDIAAIDPIRHLVNDKWSFSSAIESLPDGEIRIFNIKAESTDINVLGYMHLSPNRELQNSSLHASIKDLRKTQIPYLEGSAAAEFDLSGLNQATISIHSPLAKWQNYSVQNLNAVLQAANEKDRWSGHLAGNAIFMKHEWEGKCDFSWQNGQSLRIDAMTLQSPLASAEGNLEFFSNQLLSGETHVHIVNLHNFDIPLYGAVDATIRLKTDETQKNPQQIAEIDASANEVFYDGFQSEKLFFYANLEGPLQKPVGHAYVELQHAEYKNLFFETAAIETNRTDDDNWLISFKTEGDWREPFKIDFNGSWRAENSQISLHLIDLTGTVLSYPVLLLEHSEIKIAADSFALDDFALLIGDANLAASFAKQPDRMNAKLTLERVPLDFLSLNPLNLSVTGLINLDMDLSETKGDAKGNIKAEIIDVQIVDISASEPIRAEGQLEARYIDKRLACKADLKVNQNPLFHLSADLPMHLNIAPLQAEFQLYPAASIEASLKGPIEDLLDFFNLGAHRIEAMCDANLSLSGSLASPVIKGHCNIENGYYENYYSGFQLQNISAKILGEQQSLILRSFTAQDGQKKGKLSLKGQLQALWKEKLPFNFEGEFSRINVAEMQWVRAEAGGTLHIFGDLDGAHVNAQAAIIESDISIPEQLPTQLPDLQVKYINAPKPVSVETGDLSAKHYPIFLDMHIYAPDGIFVSGKGLNSEWKGNFQIGGTYTDMEAKGQLEMMEGEFLFSGRGFKLTEGSISFSGKPHEMPWINLAGQMRLQDLDILARLKGPLNSPQIAFQSIPPLPMGSILSHLLFGQDLSEINALQAAQIVNSLASFSPTSSSILSDTRRSLGIDRLRIIATPTSDEGAQSLSLQVGKYVTRGVLVSVSQGFEAGSTNLSVEVDLANGIIFQAESQQEQEQGKFTIKWNLNY